MEYFPETGKVIYRSRDGREQRTYAALEWLAAMVSHLPLKGEQMVKYYGYYSNRARGDRLKGDRDSAVPALLDPDIFSKEAGRNWSRLIKQIYEVDPLVCGKCQGTMRFVAFIHDGQVVRQILEHLGLWLANRRPAPRAHSPPAALHRHDPLCQLPATADDLCQLPPTAWECWTACSRLETRVALTHPSACFPTRMHVSGGILVPRRQPCTTCSHLPANIRMTCHPRHNIWCCASH